MVHTSIFWHDDFNPSHRRAREWISTERENKGHTITSGILKTKAETHPKQKYVFPSEPMLWSLEFHPMKTTCFKMVEWVPLIWCQPNSPLTVRELCLWTTLSPYFGITKRVWFGNKSCYVQPSTQGNTLWADYSNFRPYSKLDTI